jgi:hypothetical protein
MCLLKRGLINIQQTTLLNFDTSADLVEPFPQPITSKDDENEKLIQEHMSRKPAKELVKGFRMNGGHPKPEIGAVEDSEGRELTWRSVYMDELERRGKQVLIDLGWPSEMDAKYTNLYTGCIETLAQLLNGYRGDGSFERVWAVVQNWVPFNAKEPNMRLIKYLVANIHKAKEVIEKAKKGESVHGLSPAGEIKDSKRLIQGYQAELDEEIKRIESLGLSFNLWEFRCVKCGLFKPEYEDDEVIGDHVCECKVTNENKIKEVNQECPKSNSNVNAAPR